MNRNQLILLIVVGTVLGAIGLNLSRKQDAVWKESAQKMGQKLLPGFDVNAVESIAIKNASGSLTIAKKNDAWGVVERGNYPANFGTLHDFLLKLPDLKVAQPVRAGGGQLARLELLAPDKGTNGGTWVDFRDKNGKSITSLLLGKKHLRESPANSQFGGGSSPDGRYVMVGGDDKNVALISESFASLEPKADEWVDKEFIKVEKIRSIQLTASQATNSWNLSRETETGEWKLADLKGEEKLDAGKTSALNYLLSSPNFHDVAGADLKPEDTGLDKPVVSKLETFEGFSYLVKVGKADTEGHHYMQVTTSGNFPKERTSGKDEKPEDKEKLEKEFKEKTSKLDEKLKKEQFHNQWVYLIDKWGIETLLKDRREFLADKKDEAKKDDAKGAIPGGLPGGIPGLPNFNQ